LQPDKKVLDFDHHIGSLPLSRCVREMGNHTPEAKHEASSAGNTAAARRTAAHGGDERGLDGDAKKRKKADSTVPVVLGGGE
jgi:hypothetical protein